jgi:hypothetical protein
MPVAAARRAGARPAALAALALAGTVLSGSPALAAPTPTPSPAVSEASPAASEAASPAAAGDTGDIKVHDERTAADDQRNDPKACDFYLAAFDFLPNERINWTIQTEPAAAGGATRNGSVTADVAGTARTPEIDLPNGQYKLTWRGEQGHGTGKFKVFKVECPTSKAAPAAGPSGGPLAGGGGIARTEAFTPVAGAAAVGLAAVTGMVWFRLRRRPHGAA